MSWRWRSTLNMPALARCLRTSDCSNTASPECRMSRHFLRDRSTLTWRPRNLRRRCVAWSFTMAPR